MPWWRLALRQAQGPRWGGQEHGMRGIAAVEEVLVDLAVPHHQAAAQQVVRRVRALDLRRKPS